MRWWLGCENHSGAAILQLRDDTGVTATITSTSVITDGAWHHRAATYTGASGQARLYLDGALVAQDAPGLSGSFADAGAALTIGWLDLSGGFHAAGRLDEVAIFDVALDAAQIETQYQHGVNGLTYAGAGSLVTVSRSIAASADAKITQAAPTTNHGSTSDLRAVGSGTAQEDSLLRFSVSGITGSITQATLRLYATNGTVDGPALVNTSGRQASAIAPFGFTGEVQNAAGMVYLRARWYDAGSKGGGMHDPVAEIPISQCL